MGKEGEVVITIQVIEVVCEGEGCTEGRKEDSLD